MTRLLVFLLALTLIGLPVTAQTKGDAKDGKAIKSIALNFQDAWNRHDMTALAALVSRDVDFITVSGTWLKGRKEIEEHHSKLHEMQFKESVWTTKNTKVKFIKPDVAIAHVEWGLKDDKDPDGTLRQPRQGIFTWVLQKQNGKWMLIASQNTNLREPVTSK